MRGSYAQVYHAKYHKSQLCKKKKKIIFIDMFWNIQDKKTLVTVAFPNKHIIPNQDYFIEVK